MASDLTESIQHIPHDEAERRSADGKSGTVRPMHTCLAETLKCIREATDALLPQYRIIDQHRPLPKDAIEGILWGVSLLVERLDTSLGDLCADVVNGDTTPEQAVQTAHELVLQAVMELRFGARLRVRRYFIPVALPPIAELGRLYAISQRLSENLAALSNLCEGSALFRAPGTSMYMGIRTIE